MATALLHMKYKVTALTPLLVGDGRALSPVDYMVWKDQVNVLDQNRIFKLLARGPRLEGYLAQLRKATKLDFASWGGFAQNFSLRRIPFENPESTGIWNGAPPESLFIPSFASAYRGAYLPASALKGALRSGLVFSRWSAGDSVMDRVAGSLENDRLPRRTSEAAENAAGASQSRVLSLADSDPASSGNYKIFLTRTASLNASSAGGKAQIAWKLAGRGNVPSQRMTEATPVFAEMATPGTTFEGTWKERKFLENPELTRNLGWRSVPDLKLFIGAANAYARAQIELHERFAEAAGLPALQTAVERLKTASNSIGDSPQSCLLCIGWGGGFTSKAGYLATSDEAFRKILKTVPSFSRALREDAWFPKTRRVIFIAGQPASLPGWVRMEFGE